MVGSGFQRMMEPEEGSRMLKSFMDIIPESRIFNGMFLPCKGILSEIIKSPTCLFTLFK